MVIPLLTKHNRHAYFDRVLVVDVSEELQRQRLQARDQIDVQLVQQMLSSQICRHERLQLADDLISNQSTFESLYNAVDLMYDFYVSLHKVENECN